MSLWHIALWTTGVVFLAFVVAVSVPAFHGYSARKADVEAMTTVRNLLMAAAASVEVHQNLQREASAADLTNNRGNAKARTRPQALVRICSGMRQNVTIPAYDNIRPSFQLPCPSGVIVHLAITETGIHATAAHLEGRCIFVGNSLEGGVQLSNPDCRFDVPDWTGALPEGIVEQHLAFRLGQVRSR